MASKNQVHQTVKTGKIEVFWMFFGGNCTFSTVANRMSDSNRKNPPPIHHLDIVLLI